MGNSCGECPDQESGDKSSVVCFRRWVDTPGEVDRMTFVVRSRIRRAMKRREIFYGKAKNKNKAKGF